MKRQRVFWAVILSVTVIAVLGVLIQPSSAGTAPYQYKWRMNQTHPADSPFGKAAEAFAAEAKQRTNGRIEVTVYHAGALATGC